MGLVERLRWSSFIAVYPSTSVGCIVADMPKPSSRPSVGASAPGMPGMSAWRPCSPETQAPSVGRGHGDVVVGDPVLQRSGTEHRVSPA